MIEDFISGSSKKIAVHQFGHSAAAAQGIPCRSPCNGTFGDGCIEKAVIGECFCETPVYRKGTPPVPVFLTKGDHGGIDGESVTQRFKKSIPERKDFNPR